MEFSQFCACGPSGYAQLKQRWTPAPDWGAAMSFQDALCRLDALQLRLRWDFGGREKII